MHSYIIHIYKYSYSVIMYVINITIMYKVVHKLIR